MVDSGAGNNVDGNRRVVLKFGGTSVGSAMALKHAVEAVGQAHRKWPRVVVVTSAMSGVTNLLLEAAQMAILGDKSVVRRTADGLRTRHYEALDRVLIDAGERENLRSEINRIVAEFEDLGTAIAVMGEATPRALDGIAALGERMSAPLFAAALRGAGIASQAVDAVQLIVTDAQFQDALPDFDASRLKTRQVLLPMLSEGVTPVVTGFIAATPQGVTTTLGRGGSDYSAAILGALLPAGEVWIYTDVDGVMSADPRLVPDARTIPALSYREIAELAYFGAKVLHPKAIRPVIEAGITVRVCNTFNLDHPGTRLLPSVDDPELAAVPNGKIKAVTAVPGQSLVTIEGRGMLGVPGVAARAFSAVAETGTSVPLITQASSEQSICFAVPVRTVNGVIEALERVFAVELARRDIDRVWATEEVEIVTVVGAGMRNTPGIAGKVFSKLGDGGVNVTAIAQGSSEVSISLVVDSADARAAVQALHELIH